MDIFWNYTIIIIIRKIIKIKIIIIIIIIIIMITITIIWIVHM